MGIDGIGKPPGASSINIEGVPGADALRGATPFSVEPAAPGAPAAAADRISAALAGLQRGELTLDQYLDARVSEATSHLAGKLNPDQLTFVQQSLREQLVTDPVLVELVQRTTGSSSAPELR